MRDQEYDRFGPWILEISEKDTMPPVFIPHVNRDEEAIFAFKVPVRAERRDLRPGMHMYDYVVCLYENDLQVFERTGDEVAGTTIPYTGIVAIQYQEDLLDGVLDLQTRERNYSLPFNTVSTGIIEKLIGLVRKRYLPDGGDTVPSRDVREADLPENMSFYYAGMLSAKTVSEPDMVFQAYQPELRRSSIETNFWKRLFYGATDKRLLESMFFSNGNEMEVVGRGRAWRYRWQVVYGHKTLYIPLKNINRFERTPDPDNPSIVVDTFAADSTSYAFSHTAENTLFDDLAGHLFPTGIPGKN